MSRHGARAILFEVATLRQAGNTTEPFSLPLVDTRASFSSSRARRFLRSLRCHPHSSPLRSFRRQMCYYTCKEGGYNAFGLQFGDECRCGEALGDYRRHGDGTCTMPCAGDDSTICGGGQCMWALLVSMLTVGT